MEVGGWPWAKYLDDDQVRHYYFNQKTAELVYERPPGMDLQVTAKDAARAQIRNAEELEEVRMLPWPASCVACAHLIFSLVLPQIYDKPRHFCYQGWKKYFDDESGRTFYFNPDTGENSYKRPDGFVTPRDQADAISNMAVVDEQVRMQNQYADVINRPENWTKCVKFEKTRSPVWMPCESINACHQH